MASAQGYVVAENIHFTLPKHHFTAFLFRSVFNNQPAQPDNSPGRKKPCSALKNLISRNKNK